MVPVRLDRWFGPLDQKRIGRPRSSYTDSFSDLTCTARSGSDGRSGKGRGLTRKGHRWWGQRLWRSTAACSSGLRGPKRCRRCSSWRDRDDGEMTVSGVSWNGGEARLKVNGGSGCYGRDRAWRFLGVLGGGELTRRCRTVRRKWWRSRRGREVLVLRRFHARVAPAFSTIWTRSGPSFCSARGHLVMSGGCIRDPGVRWSRQEGTGWPYLAVIVAGGRLFLRDPELNCGQPGSDLCWDLGGGGMERRWRRLNRRGREVRLGR
jgi:hypothetical protein